MTSPTMAVPTRRVDMWYAGTAPQRRLTVGFRAILVIPQVIVLLFLFLATFFVVLIGWVGALFMGRLPEWVHDFVSGVVRWTTRVSAYMYLLTDRYPPFSLDDEDYPARPILPAPGRLNRWAVLFRLILVVPANVFAQIVAYGLSFPLLFVAWLITLFSGRMHPSLYPAYAALLRYQVRLQSYFLMLTSEYAWGMLGDPVAPAPPASFFAGPQGPLPGSPPQAAGYPAQPPGPAQPFSYPTGPSPATPNDAPPAGSRPESPEPAPDDASRPPAAPQPPQWPPPMPPPPPPPPTGLGAMPPPSTWERAVPAAPTGDVTPAWATLALTGAARGWVIFAIVWGSVLFVGTNVAQNVVNNHNRSTGVAQVNAVVSDYNATYTALNTAGQDIKSCTTVACLRPSHLYAASKLTQFDDDLHGMSLPANAGGPTQVVESDAGQLASILTQLASSSDLATYHSTAKDSNLTTILNSYPGDTQNLVNVLKSDL